MRLARLAIAATCLLLTVACSDREQILDTLDGMPASGQILSVAANGRAVLFWSDAANLEHPCEGCNLFLLRRPGRVPVRLCEPLRALTPSDHLELSSDARYLVHEDFGRDLHRYDLDTCEEDVGFLSPPVLDLVADAQSYVGYDGSEVARYGFDERRLDRVPLARSEEATAIVAAPDGSRAVVVFTDDAVLVDFASGATRTSAVGAELDSTSTLRPRVAFSWDAERVYVRARAAPELFIVTMNMEPTFWISGVGAFRGALSDGRVALDGCATDLEPGARADLCVVRGDGSVERALDLRPDYPSTPVVAAASHEAFYFSEGLYALQL